MVSKDRRAIDAPAIQPGQIWLIEQIAATSFCPLDRDAVTSANVVIYDRTLAPLVSDVLPIGSYAEPLACDAAVGSVLSRRALELAAEGWSVVQLVAAGAGRRARLHGAAAALCPAGPTAGVAVRVISKTPADCYQTRDMHLPELPDLLDEFGDDDLLTVVFGPLGIPSAKPADVFTANGLAG